MTSSNAARHLFFDIGGVLGTGGWDHDERARAAAHFDLDAAELERLHDAVVGMFETGQLSLDEYLDAVVFGESRQFTRDAFIEFMRAQSQPFHESVALVRALAATGRYRLMTINNESAELNQYRIERFGLVGLFDVFFSSCWMGAAKPSRRIYELALAISQADPARSVFIDDRPANLEPARAVGMTAIAFTGVRALGRALGALGITT